MPTTEQQYRSALRQIVNILEPLGWECPDHPCMGCNYEMTEALSIAMNTLSGLDQDAHWGPAIPARREEDRIVFDEPEGYQEERTARRERTEAAWRAAGFRHIPSNINPEKMVWRPPERWPSEPGENDEAGDGGG